MIGKVEDSALQCSRQDRSISRDRPSLCWSWLRIMVRLYGARSNATTTSHQTVLRAQTPRTAHWRSNEGSIPVSHRDKAASWPQRPNLRPCGARSAVVRTWWKRTQDSLDGHATGHGDHAGQADPLVFSSPRVTRVPSRWPASTLIVDSGADDHINHPKFAMAISSKKSTRLTLRAVQGNTASHDGTRHVNLTVGTQGQRADIDFQVADISDGERICIQIEWRERLNHVSPKRPNDDSSIVPPQE